MSPERRDVVVITGASAGVGRATVRRFARDRARIALLARGTDRLEAAAGEVERAGGQALVLPTDVADPGAVDEAATEAEQTLGPIDIWINNAMTSVLGEAHEITPAEYRRVMEVNYLGFVHGTLAALERMRPRDRGSIIQVGSALAFRGIPLQAPYCASKHAVQGFTESVRSELIHRGSGIHVGSVHMPALNTPQFEWVRTRLPNRPQPVPPIYQPEVAADAIHWAAHNRRAILYVGVPTLQTVLGNRVAPRALDYYLAANGYDAQQTRQPEDPDRPDNLFEPAPGDYAARGRFDDRSRRRSPQLWASKNRGWIAAGATAAALVGVLLARD
jgi:short-subunit dehydrogenase